MSIQSARKMVCDKLSDEFDTVLKPAEAAKRGIKDQISQVTSKLSLIEFSPASEINAAASGLETDVKAVIPEANEADIDEITDFIDSCDFLKNHLMFKNPVALLKGGASSAIEQSKGFVNDLSGLLPEFDVAQLLGKILNIFSGVGLGIPGALGLSSLMRLADQIINCVADRCGGDFGSRIIDMTDTLDQLYTDLNLVSDPTSANWGEFDVDKLYDDVELSAQERIQMSTVVDSVQGSQDIVMDGINSTVDATKTAARTVEGIF